MAICRPILSYVLVFLTL